MSFVLNIVLVVNLPHVRCPDCVLVVREAVTLLPYRSGRYRGCLLFFGLPINLSLLFAALVGSCYGPG